MDDFHEKLYPGWGQFFEVEKVLFETRSGLQHVIIFESRAFGRVLALDGIVQTTERDEFIYHEMLAHVPILAHGNARRVLIVGGGDGAMLREVLRHDTVEHVTQVEIDQAVIDTCTTYLPDHSAGAFDDPRAQVVIDDGLAFVSRDGERYDVIISDATDPIGPGEALFTGQFYRGCSERLAQGGVLVTQNGNTFGQLDEIATTAVRLDALGAFADWSFYQAAIPTYVGGIMAFAWAATDARMRHLPVSVLAERFALSGLRTRYYTPDVHKAAFAMPAYVEQAIAARLAGEAVAPLIGMAS